MSSALTSLGQRYAIGARRVASALFRRGRLAMQMVRNRKGDQQASRPAVLLPSRADSTTLGDAMNRVAWYLGAASSEVRSATPVTFYLPKHLVGFQPEVPDAQREVLARSPPIERRDRQELRHQDHDLLLIWDARDLATREIVSSLANVRLVDSTFYSHRASSEFVLAMEQYLGGELEESTTKELFRSNFRRLLKRGRSRPRSAALGTGPSVEEITDVDLSDTSVVVCNSIVKNESLLDHVDPVAVCFGDPVFHLGPSEYAFRFRNDLVRAVEAHDCFAVTREREARLLLRHYPELESHIVGLRHDANGWHIPTVDEMGVQGTSNILTLFMLPVAAALASEVLIGGCDGREPDEEYFWQHNPSVQYEGLMRTVFETHPAFFRDRIYEDYYREHCEQLEDQLATWEREGWSFRSVTHSFIPALVRRTCSKR